MIIVDKALQRRAEAGQPIRVALVGAGFIGRGVVQQIALTPGMTLVAASNRHVERALEAYREAGLDAQEVSSQAALEANIEAGRPSVTSDASLLCRADGVEVIIEATGTVEFAAQVVLEALEHRKHVLLMNAELDATLGPILKVYAERAGVILSGADGDHPGVQVNLVRFVQGLGLEPLLCGTVKGLLDRSRTPDTQRAYAERWGQQPHMVTSYVDGTKMALEQASVANATGMSVLRRGMLGPHFQGPAENATDLFDVDALVCAGGAVDYLLGAEPRAGVFVYARARSETQRPYLDYLKLGSGPLYCLTKPFHLCHMEVPSSVARVALFGDAVMAPLGTPRVEVVAQAKRDLRAGETLDGIGGFTAYGVCERADIATEDDLLPIGIANGCRLLRNVAQHQAIRYADVALPRASSSSSPTMRFKDKLRAEQRARFELVPQHVPQIGTNIGKG